MNPAFEVVARFERAVADFAGAAHAIAVDCCTSAIFLCCKIVQVDRVLLPARTYCSVPMAVIHAGGKVEFEDLDWSGVYQLKPYPIWDGAKRFRRGMYQGGMHTLSFHTKKHVSIGRGGMILTDDTTAAEWFRKARYDGREGLPYSQENIAMLGWHMYMTPEQAARGLERMALVADEAPDLEESYPDLRRMAVFQQ